MSPWVEKGHHRSRRELMVLDGLNTISSYSVSLPRIVLFAVLTCQFCELHAFCTSRADGTEMDSDTQWTVC
jgi:hypothetical protein